MKILYLYNQFTNTYKNISSIIISKELSKTNKVILLDFDIFSNLDKLLNDVVKLDLLSNIDEKKISDNNFLVFQFNVLINETINYESLVKWLIYLKKIFSNKFDYLIINSSSSNGLINKTIFDIANDVLVPLNFYKENSKKILEELIYIKEKKENPFKIYFLAIIDFNDANYNVNSFLKIKKNLSDLLLDNFINLNNLKDEISIINNEDVSKSYLNIIKVLYNL